MEAGEPRSDVLIGEMVDGRYRLVERIGEGGSGIVYRAVAEPGSLAVAVKILRADLGAAGGEAARRFEREALAAGKVAHDNLVGLRDFGVLPDGRPYLVMELVEGRSLADAIAEGPLPPGRALAILSHLLRGLGQAHAAGVVHRDLKPADVVLVAREQAEVAVIVDFGTAALLGGMGAAAERLTAAGVALGAPAYMAPERLDAEAAVDGRADLYSATCILFEMLTGRPPFGGDEVGMAELFARHRGAPRPTLRETAEPEPGPAALQAIVARGLAVDPAERFASAGDYLAAVQAFLEGEHDPSIAAQRAPPGPLAQPDPSKATTVFHGAPPPEALLAAAAAAPAALEAPVAAVAVAAAPAANAVGAGRRVWRAAAIAAAVLAALVLLAVLLGRTGGGVGGGRNQGAGDAPADPTAGLIEAWQADGLKPGRFATAAGDRFGGGDCRRGDVNGIDVTVCRHAGPAEARAARDALRPQRDVARAVVAAADRLLVAETPRRRPPRRTLAAIVRVFRQVAAPRAGAGD